VDNILGKARSFLSSQATRLFAAPYLPGALVRIAILLSATGICVILIGQPPIYWLDHTQSASVFTLVRTFLSTSPFLFLLVGLIYLAVIWAVLKLVTRPLTIVIWLPISFLPLYSILIWIYQLFNRSDLASLSGTIDSVAGALATLILGFFLALFLLRRKAAQEHQPRKWRQILPVALLALWGTILIVGMVFSAYYPWAGWQRIEPKHSPGPRSMAAIAYDTQRQRAVLFGGDVYWLGYGYSKANDTWEWDGHDWIQMQPKDFPPARSSSAMAYDKKHKQVVLFGGLSNQGFMLDDTWLWDGSNWKQVDTPSAPAARRGHLMYYDPQLEAVILAGGYSQAGTGSDIQTTDYNDTWEWDGENWSVLSTGDIATSSIHGAGVAYDSAGRRALAMNDDGIWVSQNAQFNRLQSEIEPANRLDTWLAADQSGDVLLFGGQLESQVYADTWILRGITWTELHPLMSPEARSGQVMFYDPIRQSFILYGGYISNIPTGEMWEFPNPK